MSLNLSKRTRAFLTGAAVFLAVAAQTIPNDTVRAIASAALVAFAAVGIIPPGHDTITDVARRAQGLGLHVTPESIRAETQKHAAESLHLTGQPYPYHAPPSPTYPYPSLVMLAKNQNTGQEIIRYPDQFFAATPGAHAVLSVDISDTHPLDRVDFHVYVVNHDGTADVTETSDDGERG